MYFDYFEDMESVGQQDDGSGLIELKSQNKNLFNGEWIDDTAIGIGEHYYYGEYYPSVGYKAAKDYIKVNPSGFYSHNKSRAWLVEYDKNFNVVRWNQNWYKYQLTPKTHYVKFYVSNENAKDFIFEERENATSYIENKESIIEISLSEPLRSLPNGVKDKIIKRNGQWVVERNIKEATFDGSLDENWKFHSSTTGYSRFINDLDDIFAEYYTVGNNLLSPEYKTLTDESSSCYEPSIFKRADNNRGAFYLNVPDDDNYIKDNFREWLSQNPFTIIYQLVKPIYEPLNIDSSINLYLDITHISNDSNIPANMVITVDRTINRAIEALELVKANPTTGNLSNARYWVNLLNESIKKDELQGEINSITNLDDMVLERKSATANLDVYVMCENMLSMSLNTNSITFDNYSGVEDIEKANAIEISINSSLPYDLNAYLQTEIKGSENSNIMDMDILKIKDSSKDSYQSFSNTTDKVTLNEDCSSGNYISHNIDLKLESSNAYSVDVYKTTIKFEAVQK